MSAASAYLKSSVATELSLSGRPIFAGPSNSPLWKVTENKKRRGGIGGSGSNVSDLTLVSAEAADAYVKASIKAGELWAGVASEEKHKGWAPDPKTRRKSDGFARYGCRLRRQTGRPGLRAVGRGGGRP